MKINRFNKVWMWPAILLLQAALLPAQADGDASWKHELLKERAEKDAEFKASATSPMAGRERLVLSGVERSFYVIRDGRVADPAASGSAHEIVLVFKNGEWFWRGGSGTACRRNGGEVAMESEPLRAGDMFATGRLTLAAYPGPDTLALIVFDPEQPQAREFRNLLYYPPDRRYAVRAKLERFAEAKPFKVTTTRDLEKTFFRYGKLRFRIGGRELELTALKSSLEGPDARYLFVPFKDDTNGGETYEVGRFLDLEEPQGDETVLDFNRCYNPLCNYSPAYNCPLPPLENFLEAEIRAGEKTYPH